MDGKIALNTLTKSEAGKPLTEDQRDQKDGQETPRPLSIIPLPDGERDRKDRRLLLKCCITNFLDFLSIYAAPSLTEPPGQCISHHSVIALAVSVLRYICV